MTLLATQQSLWTEPVMLFIYSMIGWAMMIKTHKVQQEKENKERLERVTKELRGEK